MKISKVALYNGWPPGKLTGLPTMSDPFIFVRKTLSGGPGGMGPVVKSGSERAKRKKISAVVYLFVFIILLNWIFFGNDVLIILIR